MIYRLVFNRINQLGAECVISEYMGKSACEVKGLLQPVKNRAKETTGTDRTDVGVIDNSNYNFIFTYPKNPINLENAIAYIHNKHYWLKEYNIIYFKDKPLYVQALASLYEKE